MKIKEKLQKRFTDKTMKLLKTCLSRLHMMKESYRFKSQIDMIQISYDLMTYQLKNEFPVNKARPIDWENPVGISGMIPTYSDHYKEFRRKYITIRRDHPIELLGSEIKSIVDVYRKKELKDSSNDSIFDKFNSTYFTGTRRLNLKSYYMLIERHSLDHDTNTSIIKIVPIKLPHLCKRSYSDYPLVKYYIPDAELKKKAENKNYYATGAEIKKLIFGQCNYIKEREANCGKLSHDELEMFQVYINAYNEYIMDTDFQNDKKYMYVFKTYIDKNGFKYTKMEISAKS